MRNYQLYIQDIIDASEKIIEYTNGLTIEKFKKDDKTSSAVIRKFEIIGEAAKNISEKIKQEYPEIPWNDMVGMRNILIHGYFGVDYKIIWDTIKILPALLNRLKTIE